MKADVRAVPVALTIAGSDNSAGAGAQADLKTFAAHGVYGLSAITCVVAEVPGNVEAISPVPVDIVVEQIRLCLKAFPVGAIKTGMLFSREIISAVASVLRDVNVPIVVDPVMVASSGDRLLESDAVAEYCESLFPLATLITPNADELAVLANEPISSLPVLRKAATRLAETFNVPILAKGGHLQGDCAIDILALPSGATREYSEQFILGISPHGTGCTYSSAIAAALSNGHDLEAAIGIAKDYITAAIRAHLRWGETLCLNHFPGNDTW
jgi:hydroxymethylpyrimidine/phosphomethylpyrimidine kinase